MAQMALKQEAVEVLEFDPATTGHPVMDRPDEDEDDEGSIDLDDLLEDDDDLDDDEDEDDDFDEFDDEDDLDDEDDDDFLFDDEDDE